MLGAGCVLLQRHLPSSATMVARLLSLEEAEKDQVYQEDVAMKYVQCEPHRTECASAEPELVPSKKQKYDPVLPPSKWN
jgi:U2-associated protein SR140